MLLSLFRRTTPWTVAIWALLAAVAARAERPLAPEEVLRRDKGLTRAPGGVWVLPLEQRLRSRWDELPQLEQRIVAARSHLDERIESNRKTWATTGPALASLEQAASSLRSDDPRRTAMENQIAALSSLAVSPEKLGAVRAVRTRVVELGNDLQQVALSTNWIRATVPDLHDRYDALAADPQVVASFARLQSGERLGPLREYRSELKRLDRYERLVQTASIPMFIQSGRFRFTTLVNGCAPVTFSWNESSEPTTLTASAAEAAGIVVAAGAPRSERQFGAGRKLQVAQARLQSVQIGKTTLRDVDVCILPPEGEDLGCSIGQEGLASHRATLEPERLRIRIAAAQ